MPCSASQSCRFSCSLLRVETDAEILCLFEAVARTDHVGAKASGQDRNPRSAANIADPASAAVAHQSDDRALVAIAGGTHRTRSEGGRAGKEGVSKRRYRRSPVI